jgi:hypothetical protein
VKHFGTNQKDMPPRTPYCDFFIKAIDDFMLKLLLVCATINIGFEVGFAHDNNERKTGKYLPRFYLCAALASYLDSFFLMFLNK